MGFDFDPLAGLKTDDLKAKLEVLREDIRARQSTFSVEMMALDAAVNDLTKMEEKTDFVVAQLEQISSITTPAPPSDAEVASDALDKYFTDPVFLASTGMGAVGGGMMVVGGIGKVVSKRFGPKVKLGKAAKAGKATKFVKFLKVGKGVAGLGAALAMVELAVGMVSAQKINKQLKKDKAALNKHIDEADAEIKELRGIRKDAEAAVRSLLDEAGVADGLDAEFDTAEAAAEAHEAAISGYLRHMNDAIAQLSAQTAKVRMVRKMVLSGALEPDMIADMTEVDETVVSSIAERVAVELALVSGRSVVEVARDSGLLSEQVLEIEGVVRARNEAVAGEDPERIAELVQVTEAVVQGEDEATMPLLASSWGAIEADDDLEAIGRKAVVAASALSRLRSELRAKTELAGGIDPAAVAQSANRSIEAVSAWGVDVAEARADIAILKRDGKLGKPALMAAQMRMPLALVA